MQLLWLLVVAAVAYGPLYSVEADCKTPWKDCGSTDIHIQNVVVENCCAVPCTIILGQTTNFSFTFSPDKTYDDLKQKACGMVNTTCIEFPNEQFGDMCKCPGCVLNGTCPFKAHTGYNLSVPVPLQASFPVLTTLAKWEIFDGSTQIGCFEIPVKTVKLSRII